MKILTVVYSLGKGGTERAAQNFAEAYKLAGHDSRVLATKNGGPRVRELEAVGVKVWVNDTERTLRKIHGWQPDLIHLHSHKLAAREVLAILDCTPVSRVIETNVFSRPSPWEARLDKSFQLSKWCAWIYKRRSNSGTPIGILPNPIRPQSFIKASQENILKFRRQFGFLESDIVFGRVGQSFNSKWSPLLIDVFEYFRSRGDGVRLMLASPPKAITSRVESSIWRDSITIIDEIIGDENLSIFYSSSDIFVHIADRGESFGMVLAESMLCETPVIAFSTPWGDNSQCEVVGHRVGGLIVRTKKGLRDAITTLMNDRALRERLGKQGREKVLDEYDYRKLAEAALCESADIDAQSIVLGGAVQSIYNKSFDRPNLLASLLLRNANHLLLLRYVSGYESWLGLLNRIVSSLRKGAGN